MEAVSSGHVEQITLIIIEDILRVIFAAFIFISFVEVFIFYRLGDCLKVGLSDVLEFAKLWGWHVIDHFYFQRRQWGRDS